LEHDLARIVAALAGHEEIDVSHRARCECPIQRAGERGTLEKKHFDAGLIQRQECFFQSPFEPVHTKLPIQGEDRQITQDVGGRRWLGGMLEMLAQCNYGI
jgi:hypothetical protein